MLHSIYEISARIGFWSTVIGLLSVMATGRDLKWRIITEMSAFSLGLLSFGFAIGAAIMLSLPGFMLAADFIFLCVCSILLLTGVCRWKKLTANEAHV